MSNNKAKTLITITIVCGIPIAALYLVGDVVLPLFRFYMLSGDSKFAMATVIENTRTNAYTFGTRYRWKVEYDGYQSTLSTSRPMQPGQQVPVVYAVQKPSIYIVGRRPPQGQDIAASLALSPSLWAIAWLLAMGIRTWVTKRKKSIGTKLPRLAAK